jgi:threonine dehydrogenase-like Zn-dependent dehydrogenase
MKAAVFHGPGHIEVRSDVAEPRAGAGEVLVEVQACGICGSDLHLYRTNAHRHSGGVLRIDPDGREIPGHEYAGTIVALGEGVQGWRVGERVVGVTGGGGFAERVPVPVNPFQIARMPEGLSFEEAATTEPLADGLQLVRKAAPQPGENVVVYGVGIIGLGVIQALRALCPDVGHVIAIDVQAQRLEKALEVGATHGVNAADTDVVRAVGDLCGWVSPAFPRMTVPDVGVVIECAGYLQHMKGPPPLQNALNLLRPRGGRIVCFGAYEAPVTLELMPLIHKEPTIIGSMGYGPTELDEALSLMASGKVDRKRLISHRFPLSRIRDAFVTQGGGGAIKVMVEPRESTP